MAKTSLFSAFLSALHDSKAEAGKIFCIGLVVALFRLHICSRSASYTGYDLKMCGPAPHNDCYAVLLGINGAKPALRGEKKMTDKELKKLSRAELLELLLESNRENERLRKQLEKAKGLLANRAIEIENAGSIAEAALALNGVFEAAQKAADQYLENVRRLAEGQPK